MSKRAKMTIIVGTYLQHDEQELYVRRREQEQGSKSKKAELTKVLREY